MKKTLLAVALTSSMGISAAQAATTFDMWDPSGNYFNTDATVTGSVNEGAGTWAVSSTTPFAGLIWTASNGILFGEGTHTVSTIADPGTCGAAVCARGPDVTFSVGAGQLGGQIKFAWGVTTGIDVINIWDVTATGYSAVTVIPMVDGPFPSFQATFHIDDLSRVGVKPNEVPIPAAAWLFGTGLLGLIGVARRKKAA